MTKASDMKIVAFGHVSNAGKDTTIKFLGSHIRMSGSQKSFKKRGISSTAKRHVYEMFKCCGAKTEDHYDDHPGDKDIVLSMGKTIRDLWIAHCLKLREVDPYCMARELINQEHKCDYLWINDLRAPQEYEIIKEAGGIIVYVDSPMAVYRSEIDHYLDHLEPDYRIKNTGTRDDLYREVEKFAKEVLNVS